jgi:single-stranded DNA-binding protein
VDAAPRQGPELAVTGQLELDRWEADGGGKPSRLYVIAERVEFLRRPVQSSDQPADSDVDGSGEPDTAGSSQSSAAVRAGQRSRAPQRAGAHPV